MSFQIEDPLVKVIAETLLEFQRRQIPKAEKQYGPLGPALTALLIRLQSRIKELHLGDRELIFESLVSFTHQLPLVRVIWGEKEGQLTSEEARETAMKLWDVAHGAEADTFLVTFFTDALSLPKEHMYDLLNEFRQFRKRQEELQQKPTPQPQEVQDGEGSSR